MLNTRYNIQLGSGVTWRGSVWIEAVGSSRALKGITPANISVDLMLMHKFDEHWKVAFNMYNATNRLNYDYSYSIGSEC